MDPPQNGWQYPKPLMEPQPYGWQYPAPQGPRTVVAPPGTPKRPGLAVSEAETLRQALRAGLEPAAEPES